MKKEQGEKIKQLEKEKTEASERYHELEEECKGMIAEREEKIREQDEQISDLHNWKFNLEARYFALKVAESCKSDRIYQFTEQFEGRSIELPL